MTEYEMSYLFNEMINTSQQMMMDELSMETAFIATAFFAAHRLSKAMSGLVIAFYVYALWGQTARLIMVSRNFFGLRHKMQALADAGGGLEWHGAVIHGAALQFWEDNMALAMYGQLAITLAASIWFFLHCRAVNGQTAIVQIPATPHAT